MLKNTEPIVKEFSINDFPKICEVFMQTFNSPPWNDKNTIETSRVYLQELLDNKRFVGFTLWKNDLLIGFVLCHTRYNWRGDDITIDIMCILPNFQQKGYGKILFNAVENFSKNNSIICIGLHTGLNTPAFNFYEKLGFEQDKESIFMRKEIK